MHACVNVQELKNESFFIYCLLFPVFAPGAGECVHGEVRLVGGNVSSEGRVEVCIAGYWGTVCDDRFAQVDAIVVCRSLNFSDAGNWLCYIKTDEKGS